MGSFHLPTIIHGNILVKLYFSYFRCLQSPNTPGCGCLCSIISYYIPCLMINGDQSSTLPIQIHRASYFPVPRIPTRLQRSWGSPPLVAPAVGGENIYAHWDGSERTFEAKHIGIQWISCFLARNRDPIARKARDVFIRIQRGYLINLIWVGK